ncbi:hypothetical protein [Rhizobium tubonense]|uniref:Uncharacterized protein n=1 Tax=Rhizobium tubonense TaxID=484088 RepID=A0A2W4E4Y7_9HYPH|nr:hypothetical protein [Rhizobium tubonense]PZM07603.1 hypothetical protein CPY51_31230 [Rhizobium tubonense]
MPNTIPAAGEAMPETKTIADLFEAPIDHARRMTSILLSLTEEALLVDMTEYGHPSHYYLTKPQVEDIIFSIYQTQGFLNQVHDAFLEAIR